MREGQPRQILLGVLPSLICLASLSGRTFGADQAYLDYARVLDVEPIEEVVQAVPGRARCASRFDAERADAAITGDVRQHSPGISIGEAIAEEIQHRDRTESLRECRMATPAAKERRIVAYRVRYRYGGDVYERRMAWPPGDEIPVRVHLRPVLISGR